MARYNEEPLRPRMSIAQAAAWVNPVSGDEAENVNVRKAMAADAEVICGFLKEMRDTQARKRPDIVSRDEEILTLDEVAEAIEDPSKLVFVAENDKGEVVGHILCEMERAEELPAAVAEEAAEAVETAVEGAAESIAEAAEPVPAALEPLTEAPVEAVEEAVEAVAEAAEEPAVEAEVPTVKPVPGKLVIANIYVTDAARRQRIGTELYHEARREAEKQGCIGAELSCWLFDKEGMYFFEKLGYKPLLVTMEKKLGD